MYMEEEKKRSLRDLAYRCCGRLKLRREGKQRRRLLTMLKTEFPSATSLCKFCSSLVLDWKIGRELKSFSELTNQEVFFFFFVDNALQMIKQYHVPKFHYLRRGIMFIELSPINYFVFQFYNILNHIFSKVIINILIKNLNQYCSKSKLLDIFGIIFQNIVSYFLATNMIYFCLLLFFVNNMYHGDLNTVTNFCFY